jgi:hypothetical protein
MEDLKSPFPDLTAFVHFTAYEFKIPMHFGNEFGQVQQALGACVTDYQEHGQTRQASLLSLSQAFQRLMTAIDDRDRVISREILTRQKL